MTKRDSIVALLLLLITLTASVVIWQHGAAANPYAVLALVPMAAAMLLLPFRLAWLVMGLGIAGQLWQLQAELPTHHQMDTHYRAMVYGQVFAALLLGVTLHWLRVRIVRQQQAIRSLQQRQHRDEQLVSIGTAAAQFSHEVASPIQTIQFLLEDVRQQYPNDADLQLAEQQVKRIHNLLLDWRQVAEDVRTHRLMPFEVHQLLQQLQDALLIARPDIHANWHDQVQQPVAVRADRTLLPALLSLLHNAADAAQATQQQLEPEPLAHPLAIEVLAALDGNDWVLTISNTGSADELPPAPQLGQQLLPSSRGAGAGTLLSYSTIERFQGRVSWRRELISSAENLIQVVAEIRLPTEPYSD